MLQVTGGGIDQKDIFGENIDVEKTIKREAMEELKINLNDKESILYNRMSYLYVSEDNEQPGVQLFSKAKSKMTVEEMRKYFEEYYEYLKENNLEIEFGKLHFIKKGKTTEELEKSWLYRWRLVIFFLLLVGIVLTLLSNNVYNLNR